MLVAIFTSALPAQKSCRPTAETKIDRVETTTDLAEATRSDARVDDDVDWLHRRAVVPDDTGDDTRGMHLGSWTKIQGDGNRAFISNDLNVLLWNQDPSQATSVFWDNIASGSLENSMSCEAHRPHKHGENKAVVRSRGRVDWNFLFSGGVNNGRALTQEFTLTFPSGKVWKHKIDVSNAAETAVVYSRQLTGNVGASLSQSQEISAGVGMSRFSPLSGSLSQALGVTSHLYGDLTVDTAQTIASSAIAPISGVGFLETDDLHHVSLPHVQSSKKDFASAAMKGNALVQNLVGTDDETSATLHQFYGEFHAKITATVDHEVVRYCRFGRRPTGSATGGGTPGPGPQGGVTPGGSGSATGTSSVGGPDAAPGGGAAPLAGAAPGASASGSRRRYLDDPPYPDEFRGAVFVVHIPILPGQAQQPIHFRRESLGGAPIIDNGLIEFINLEDDSLNFEAPSGASSASLPAGSWTCRMPLATSGSGNGRALVKLSFDPDFAPEQTARSVVELIGDPITVSDWSVNWHSAPALRAPAFLPSGEVGLRLDVSAGFDAEDITLSWEPADINWTLAPELHSDINGRARVTMMPAEKTAFSMTLSWGEGALTIPVIADHDAAFAAALAN